MSSLLGAGTVEIKSAVPVFKGISKSAFLDFSLDFTETISNSMVYTPLEMPIFSAIPHAVVRFSSRRDQTRPIRQKGATMIQMGKVTAKQIGDTIYIVRSRTSTTANETAYEKVRRLILDDTEKSQRTLPKTLEKSSEISFNKEPS